MLTFFLFTFAIFIFYFCIKQFFFCSVAGSRNILKHLLSSPLPPSLLLMFDPQPQGAGASSARAMRYAINYITAMVWLSLPLACCSDDCLQHRSVLLSLPAAARTRLLFVPEFSTLLETSNGATARVAWACPALLRRGDELRRPLGARIRRARVHDLAPVAAERADASEEHFGVVKELSSDLMVPGVSMVLTLTLSNGVGLVTQQEIANGGCWIAVNGIPLKLDEAEPGSNFWGTKRWLDVRTLIPPDHLDEAGLGLLYPGDEVAVARIDERDAMAFKAEFAAQKERERLAQQEMAEKAEAEARRGEIEAELQASISETQRQLQEELGQSLPSQTSAGESD